jgi:hypothetical protein
MARCEDFPCCGHEAGCCPDYDEGGQQMNMKCVCGATVPLSSRSSLCSTCLSRDEEGGSHNALFDNDDLECPEECEEDCDECPLVNTPREIAPDAHLDDCGE